MGSDFYFFKQPKMRDKDIVIKMKFRVINPGIQLCNPAKRIGVKLPVSTCDFVECPTCLEEEQSKGGPVVTLEKGESTF